MISIKTHQLWLAFRVLIRIVQRDDDDDDDMRYQLLFKKLCLTLGIYSSDSRPAVTDSRPAALIESLPDRSAIKGIIRESGSSCLWHWGIIRLSVYGDRM